jgi:hypothetical protein
MKFAKPLLIAAAVNLSFAMASQAQEELSKEQLKEIAFDSCVESAKSRYGAESIVDFDKLAKTYSSKKRIKWQSGLSGVTVNMKIKPEKKRKAKYICLVKTDKTVEFFKS